MKLPIFSPQRKGVSDDLNPARLLNMFYEVDPQNKSNIGFLQCPGHTLKANLGTSGIRGGIVFKGYLYIVHYNELWKIDTTFSVRTVVGNLTTFYDNVSMSENGVQLMIVDGPAGYIWDGTTFQRITDPDFTGADFVQFKDGYFIFNIPDTGKVAISAAYDGLNYDALDYKTAEGAPDELRAIVADQEWLWNFGRYTTELWYNAGATFPFQRAQNGVLQWGIVAPWSAVSADNSVVWLGNNKDGEAVVLRASGPGSPKIISNKGMAHEFGKMSKLDDAEGFAYLLQGDIFYQLSFPTAERTFVYQFSVNEWFERSRFAGGRHRARNHVYFEQARTHVIGDYANGNLYALEPDTYTDNGERILKEIDSRILSKDNKRLFHNHLILDCETGVGNTDDLDPKVEMLYSDDNGRINSAFIERSLGPKGHYADPPRWNRLGSAVNRVYKFRCAAKSRFRVFGAYGDYDVGEVDQ